MQISDEHFKIQEKSTLIINLLPILIIGIMNN